MLRSMRPRTRASGSKPHWSPATVNNLSSASGSARAAGKVSPIRRTVQSCLGERTRLGHKHGLKCYSKGFESQMLELRSTKSLPII